MNTQTTCRKRVEATFTEFDRHLHRARVDALIARFDAEAALNAARDAVKTAKAKLAAAHRAEIEATKAFTSSPRGLAYWQATDDDILATAQAAAASQPTAA